MARSFASASSQHLVNTSWTAGTEPLTLACWGYPLQTNASNVLLSVNNGASADGRYFIAYGSGGTVTANKENDAGTSSGSTGSAYLANTWSHVCGVFASDTSRTAYHNGVAGAFNATSVTDPTITTITVGAYVPSGGAAFAMNGRLAHAAVWNAALTADEVAALYNNGIGADPRSIRPDALLAYWPLLDNDGDRDWWGPWHMTATNSPTYDQHPPVLMKSRPTVVVMGGSAAPTISSVTLSGTRQIGQTITATVATSPASVDSIAYQWQKAATDDADPGTDISGETSSTLALTYADFGDLLDTAAYVRCQAIATNGGQDSSEVASDWLSVSLPTGSGAGGSLFESSLIR